MTFGERACKLGTAVLACGMLTFSLAPLTHAATTYTFEADTLGQTPANTSVGAGTFEVASDDILGKSLRATSQAGVIAAINFTSFASSSDQSVVWKQAYSNTLSRGGFTLRSQATDTGVANSAGAKQGYLFHVYDTSSVYIWRVGPSSYTALYSGSLTKAEPRWFKATAIGTQLTFAYSNDGSTYTGLATVTDATYTGGTVQYTVGYGGSVGNDYVDDIVITNIDTDLTNPTIQSLSPADNAAGVSPSANLVMTFTEAVDAESGLISIYKASDDSLVEAITVTDGKITGSGSNTITINPAATLESSTAYYITVAATAFDDAAGNSFAGISASTTWNFTTADVGAPGLVSVSPADNATGVAIGTDLVITFDEAVDAETGSIRVYDASDDSLIEAIDVTSGQVSGSGTSVITASLLDDLAQGTSYYVQIDASAFDDAAGNSYAGITDETSWNFSTVAAPDERVSESQSNRSTSVASRIRNLMRIGNTERAEELMREYPGLYSSPASSSPASSCTSYTFTRTLQMGSEGEDVRNLQRLLNCLGFAVSDEGPGSPGEETLVFSTKTDAAVRAFQAQYAAEVLVPAGLASPSGIFGSYTQQAMTAVATGA